MGRARIVVSVPVAWVLATGTGPSQSHDVHGLVLNERDEAVAGATVRLVLRRSQGLRRPGVRDADVLWDTTDADGRFAFTSIRQQRVQLIVNAAGYAPYVRDIVPASWRGQPVVLQRRGSRPGEPGTARALAPRSVLPVFGVHWGAPLSISAAFGVGVVVGRDFPSHDVFQKSEKVVFTAFEPGRHGFRTSAGWANYVRSLPGTGDQFGEGGGALGIRATFLQRGYRSDAARYLGLEGSLFTTPICLCLRVGAFSRIDGIDRRRFLFTIDMAAGF